MTLNFLFPENPEIALLVYNLILHISKTERHINYYNFELASNLIKLPDFLIVFFIVELLVKDPMQCREKEFREKEKIDILALATVDSFKLSREELRALNISYVQALDFVKVTPFFNINLNINTFRFY